MVPPEQAPNNDKTNMVFMTIAEVDGQLFTDQTGRFPITSSRGHNYIVIFYVVDANYIKSYPIKSRHRTELINAYTDVSNFLRTRGYRPQLHKLDNETSKDVEEFIADNNATHQYTPPDMHHTNPAERAIRTWKNHFVAIRAGTPSTYRLSNWCKDLEQTDITLNMMRPCTQNLKLSAHEAMEGMFSFDATPMAPIGTECMVHVKPSRRHTWGYHAIKAWYFAPALNHYRWIRVVTDTGAVHTTDTFTFLHHTIQAPTITAADRIIRATKHLKQAIDGHNTPAPDELEAIAALKALITGSPPDPLLPDPAVEPSPHVVTTTVDHYDDEPAHLPLHSMPMPSLLLTTHAPPFPTTARPTTIPFHDDEIDDASSSSHTPVQPHTRYNLRSHAQHIIQSALNDGLVISPDHIAFAVINEATGKAMEYRDLIKLDTQKNFGLQVMLTNLDASPKAYETSLVLTPCSSFTKQKYLRIVRQTSPTAESW
jgi:hypothetical protein